MKKSVLILIATLICSCAAHKRSNIQSDEEFVVELRKPKSRGLIETVLEGVFFGTSYLADKTSKSLVSSYTQSLSINNYYHYNKVTGDVKKTYKELLIKKYSKPKEAIEKNRISSIVSNEIKAIPKTRGGAQVLHIDEFVREKEDDLLEFYAAIELISDPENPGITRLSFNQLRILFSKTKVFKDENLNARISLSIEGQWRSEDGSPMNSILIEQQYDFKNLKYGAKNLIKKPILSPWYYDIPTKLGQENNKNFGVVKVNVTLEEYEGNKSRYINKLPSLLRDNKQTIISDGSFALKKITN